MTFHPLNSELKPDFKFYNDRENTPEMENLLPFSLLIEIA